MRRARDYVGQALNFLFRPKLSGAEVWVIVCNAAAAKGWHLTTALPPERHMHWYDGLAFIEGTDAMVVWMVDGRTGEVLQMEPCDELEEADDI